MEFREYARVRFAKENKDNGLVMDKDYPDGLRNRIMNRLNAIINPFFCLGLLKSLEWEGKGKYPPIEKEENNYKKKEQIIKEIENEYTLLNPEYEKILDDNKYNLNRIRERIERYEEKLCNYPMGRVILFSDITMDEMILFDYILDTLSVQNEKNTCIDLLKAVQKGLWEKISKDNRIKLLQLLEKAVDSDGDLWVTEKCWRDTCNKIMYPVQYRIKHNLEDLLKFVDEQKMSSYQEAEWLQKLDKKIEKIRNQYIAKESVEDILEQIEKYIE